MTPRPHMLSMRWPGKNSAIGAAPTRMPHPPRVTSVGDKPHHRISHAAAKVEQKMRPPIILIKRQRIFVSTGVSFIGSALKRAVFFASAGINLCWLGPVSTKLVVAYPDKTGPLLPYCAYPTTQRPLSTPY